MPSSVAVVIPLFNHQDYIAEALRSVLEQTVPPQKIVVVDDGSTDDSVRIVRGFSDPRIELVTQENAGAHCALQRGIAAADCEIVAILNSDDRFAAERLEKCTLALKENPAWSVVCTGLKMIDRTGAELAVDDPKARRLRAVWAARTDPISWLGVANFAKTTSNLVARSAYLRARPFRPYRYVHDHFFLIRAALEEKLGVLESPLLFYRTHPTNTIKSAVSAVRREALEMNLDLLRELAPELATSPKLRLALAHYFRTLSGNSTDFRLELFLLAIAQNLHSTSTEKLLNDFTLSDPTAWPELASHSGNPFSENAAISAAQKLAQELLKSRWVALGRLLGFEKAAAKSAGLANLKSLNSWKRELQRSRWLRLGQRLGCFTFPQ